MNTVWLSADLLLSIVEASPVPLHTYLDMLSLSHRTRLAVRGTPRELSFAEDHPDDSPWVITADALAAIVGPCMGLVKLTFPRRICPDGPPPLVGCGLTEAACLTWVMETFAGHRRLAVLRIPWAEPLRPAMGLILKQLPGLEELGIDDGELLPFDLAQSCPRLQALYLASAPPTIHTALVPLAGNLKALAIPADLGEPSLGGLLPGLLRLEQLELHGRSRDLLKDIPGASQLTRLSLEHFCARGDPCVFGATVGAGLFCRLVSLTWAVCCPKSHIVADQMLAASRATLKCVSFDFNSDPTYGTDHLLGTLVRLPHLARLSLRSNVVQPFPFLAILPPALIDRLEYLAFAGHCGGTLNITSSRLRVLRLATDGATLTLACPALEELALHRIADADGKGSPRLASIEELAGAPRLRCTASVPDEAATRLDGPTWLPRLGGCPRLRDVSFARIPHPAALSHLWRLAALSRLRVSIGTSAFPNPPVFRLPDGLESLRMVIIPERFAGMTAGAIDLRVEGSGLRSLCLHTATDSVSTAPPMRLTLCCPSLAALALEIPSITTFGMDQGTAPALRSLETDPRPVRTTLDAASLLAVLTQHGAHLRHVALHWCPPSFQAAWPQLAAALNGLPLLASLVLGNPPIAHLALACPHLRQLRIPPPHPECSEQRYTALEEDRILMAENPRTVEIASPLLEELEVPFGPPFERLEVAGGAPNLRRIAGVTPTWSEELTQRFPQAALRMSRCVLCPRDRCRSCLTRRGEHTLF
ncbi:hypothetical protein PAPYR_10352 [Paratrimastix pyriformis]|uniref:Uncharacterized protein n=1 Tax=Paratrimastix pyriformis TaxID=342808 RepID=A0ABQ8U675_9EUKA|nr:hypothetical protein PAPYR_10352 [Paratrimastix pyriformis]